MDGSPGREGTERSSFVVAVLLLCASAGVLIALATMQSRSKDFMSYYAAGTLARTAPDRLYSLERQQEIELPLTDAPSFLPWVHPAAEALLFAPLSALPYRTAFAVWAVINAALLALSLWLLRRRLRAMGEGTYAIAAVCGIPILAGFWGGQDHLLTLLLWVLGYLHAEEGRD